MKWRGARLRGRADGGIASILSLLVSAMVIAGCSGGETGTGLTDQTGQTTNGPGVPDSGGKQVVVGEITGFGSVFVNGIEFETGSSTVRIGNNPGSESDLAVGMVVAVYGDVDDSRQTGTAGVVAFENEVEGIVLANNYPASLNVMGQIVIFDNDTVFESNIPGVTSIKDISKKDHVEVSGFSTNTGTIYATRITVTGNKRVADSYVVRGRIESLSLDNRQFLIGGMSISYDAATVMAMDGPLHDGLLVKVVSTQAINGNQPLYAQRIKALAARDYEKPGAAAAIEMEGVVTSGLAGDQFQLNDLIVQLNDDTQLRNGARSDIVTGQKVKVMGSILADNALHAERINIVKTSQLEIKSVIESIDYMTNKLTVLGKVFSVNSMTIMKHDRMNPSEAIFNLAYLSPGDAIEIKGYADPDSDGFIATSLERGTNQTAGIEGVIDNIQGDVLHIQSIAINISQLPPGQFKADDVGRKVELDIESNSETGDVMATGYAYDD